MRMAIFSAALSAVFCIGAAASAQEEAVGTRAFVDQIALSAGRDDALARWNDRVCIGVAGLAGREAQALVDRVSARAQAVGLRTGAPGCRANVMVIFAPDSDAISREIVNERRDLLYGEDNRVAADRTTMEDFASTPRPIRWWHISGTGAGSVRLDEARSRQATGRAAALAAATTGVVTASDVGSAQDIEGADAVRANGTRARAEVRNNLSYVLLIVDARRVANVPAEAWMDYVAFNALAQIDPDSRPNEYSTILNLFSQPDTAPTAMTSWDTAYLEALYRARNEASTRQISSIARRMEQRVHE